MELIFSCAWSKAEGRHLEEVRKKTKAVMKKNGMFIQSPELWILIMLSYNWLFFHERLTHFFMDISTIWIFVIISRWNEFENEFEWILTDHYIKNSNHRMKLTWNNRYLTLFQLGKVWLEQLLIILLKQNFEWFKCLNVLKKDKFSFHDLNFHVTTVNKGNRLNQRLMAIISVSN